MIAFSSSFVGCRPIVFSNWSDAIFSCTCTTFENDTLFMMVLDYWLTTYGKIIMIVIHGEHAPLLLEVVLLCVGAPKPEHRLVFHRHAFLQDTCPPYATTKAFSCFIALWFYQSVFPNMSGKLMCPLCRSGVKRRFWIWSCKATCKWKQ